MTWKQLSDKILTLPQEQQETDLSILLMTKDEVMPVIDFVTDWGAGSRLSDADIAAMGVSQVDGVLDENHPYLTVDF